MKNFFKNGKENNQKKWLNNFIKNKIFEKNKFVKYLFKITSKK